MPAPEIIALIFLCVALVAVAVAFIAVSWSIAVDHFAHRAPVNKELLALVKQIYEGTEYKDTPWAKRAKVAIDKAEKARGNA